MSEHSNCPMCNASLHNGRFWLVVCPKCNYDLEDTNTKPTPKPVAASNDSETKKNSG